MFETNDFRAQLQSAISSESTLGQMKDYETGIVAYLQQLAETNETVLMESEEQRAIGSRRGIQDALTSARFLVREAASTARAEGRTLLTQKDIETAYKMQFCRVWPFCR